MTMKRATNSEDYPALGQRYTRPHSVVRMNETQLTAREQVLQKIDSGGYGMESVLCLCDAPVGSDIVLTWFDRYGLRARNVLCTKCGLVRLDPRMKPLSYKHFYQFLYRPLYGGSAVCTSEIFEARVRYAEERVNYLKSHLDLEGMRVIELGCAAGWNLIRLRDWGAEVVGYDFDRNYLGLGKREYGLDLRYGGVEEALSEMSHPYDLVILSHVVEHMLSPIAEIAQVADLCSPRSCLYIEVPGLFSLHRSHVDPLKYWQNAHTFSFTLTTLQGVAESAGFFLIRGDEYIRSLWQRNDLCPVGEYRPVANRTEALSLLKYLRRWERFHPLKQLITRVVKPVLASRVYRRMRSGYT